MDAKGRVSLASKYRKALPDDLVIVRSANRKFPSLSLYASDAYDAWVESVFEGRGGYRANSDSDVALRHKMFRQKEDVTVDQAGRILVPQTLRQYASLEKSVVVIGSDDHVEIWNADILEQYEMAYDELEILDLP
jgi:MraZ protein